MEGNKCLPCRIRASGDKKEVVEGKKGPSYCIRERWPVVEIEGNVGGGGL